MALAVIFGIGMAVVLTTLFAGLWRAMTATFLTDRSAWWAVADAAARGILVAVVTFALSFAAGSTIARREAQDILYWLGTVLPFLVTPIAVLVVVALGFRTLADRRQGNVLGAAVGGALGLLWSLVASPGDMRLWGVTVPLGSLLLTLVLAIVGAFARRGQPIESGLLVEPAELDDAKLARSLFDHGPVGTWRANVGVMLDYAIPIAIVPTAYLAWSLVQALPDRTSTSTSVALLAASVLSEGGRWLATAAVFGILYPFLPGRGGPYKAAVLAALWFAPALVTEVVNRWLGAGTGRVWTFPALQLLLFLSVLGVLYDRRTMKAANGRWADVQYAYGVERTRSLLVVSTPMLLAVLAITQQVVSGTGFEFVTTVVERLTDVAPAG